MFSLTEEKWGQTFKRDKEEVQKQRKAMTAEWTADDLDTLN